MAKKLTPQEKARRFSLQRRKKLRREIDLSELWGLKVYLGRISSIDALEIQESFNGKDPEKLTGSDNLKFALRAAARMMELEDGTPWYEDPDQGFEELLDEDNEVQNALSSGVMEYLQDLQSRAQDDVKKNSKQTAATDSDSSSPRS